MGSEDWMLIIYPYYPDFGGIAQEVHTEVSLVSAAQSEMVQSRHVLWTVPETFL